MSKTNGKNKARPDSQETPGDGRTAKGTFAPGVSGNPSGRGAGYGMQVSKAWRELLDETVSGGDEKRSKRRLLMEATFAKAVKGDVQAMKLIWDRVWPTTLQIDANVTGLSATRVLDVFGVMAEDYVAKGRLPDLTDRS